MLAAAMFTAAGVALGAAAFAGVDRSPQSCGEAVEQARQVVAATGVVPPPEWTVVYPCDEPGWGGSVDLTTRTINIYVLTHYDIDGITWTFLHERAHALDAEYGTEETRAWWRESRGLGDGPWWGGMGTLADGTWSSVPSEDYAEAAALCINPDGTPRIPDFVPPTVDQCAAVAALMGTP
jgi:hypothetical protein